MILQKIPVLKFYPHTVLIFSPLNLESTTHKINLGFCVKKSIFICVSTKRRGNPPAFMGHLCLTNISLYDLLHLASYV